MKYTYDPRLNKGIGGYRDSSGRVVSRKRVDDALSTYIDNADARGLTQQLQQGEINIPVWQSTMRQIIKDGNLNAVMVERGGVSQMSQSDFGRAGQIIRGQYEALDNWANQIASGEAPLDGRMLARADLYVDKVYSTYTASEKRSAELTPELSQVRNKLDPSVANHCDGCLAETRKGWVPINSSPPRGLIPIGQRDCLSRDRCSYEYQ